MKRHFLWVRAWPRYLSAFPFVRFDNLDDEAIHAELTALAREWDLSNVGRLEEHRQAERARLRTKPGGVGVTARILAPGEAEQMDARRTQPIPELQLSRADTFNEIAVLAGWRDPSVAQVVTVGKPLAHLPEPRRYFVAIDDGDHADAILDVLRLRLHDYKPKSRVTRSGRAFKLNRDAPSPGHPAVLRYGVTPSADLNRAAVVDLQLRLDDFEANPTDAAPWLQAVADEAARIALAVQELELVSETVVEEPRPAGKPEPKLAASKIVEAAHAYEWMVTRDPSLLEGGHRNYAKVHQALRGAIALGDCPFYVPPARIAPYESWERYARAGINAESPVAREPRAGREHGSSIVDSDSI